MSFPKLGIAAAAAASLGLAAPVAAQHAHHPGMQMPAKPPAKKPVAKKPAAKKKAPAVKKKAPAAKKAVAKAAARRKAAPAPKRPRAKAPPAKPVADPHAGHDMAPTAAPAPDPHAGHDMSSAAPEGPLGTNLPAGNAAAPAIPTDRAADAVYGAGAMATGRHHLEQHHGGQKLGQVMFNLAEYQARKGRDGFEWDAEGWYGGDIRRLVVRSEGEGSFRGSLERAEVQALYSHAIGPYFNLQGGLRYDFKPNPSRVYATVGFEGLAPSFFDVEGALFLSNKGELIARAEGYYDQRITQRLILQPRAELNFAAQSSREIGVGAGLSDAELGLRLRYDIRREFSPYVGVQYERLFGKTRRFARAEGEDAAGWSLLAGLRAWF